MAFYNPGKNEDIHQGFLSVLGNDDASSPKGFYAATHQKKASSTDLESIDDLLKLAKEKGLLDEAMENEVMTPKLSAIERLVSGLGALNPAEAISRQMEGTQNFMMAYPETVVQSVASALTGNDYGEQTKKRYFADVARNMGIENNIAVGGIGLVGDILLDPSTYFGGAIMRAGVGVVKVATKAAAKAGIGAVEKASPLAAEKLIEAGKNIKEATGELFIEGWGSTTGLRETMVKRLGTAGRIMNGLMESNMKRLGSGVLNADQMDEFAYSLLSGKNAELKFVEETNENLIETFNKAYPNAKFPLKDAEGAIRRMENLAASAPKTIERLTELRQRLAMPELAEDIYGLKGTIAEIKEQIAAITPKAEGAAVTKAQKSLMAGIATDEQQNAALLSAMSTDKMADLAQIAKLKAQLEAMEKGVIDPILGQVKKQIVTDSARYSADDIIKLAMRGMDPKLAIRDKIAELDMAIRQVTNDMFKKQSMLENILGARSIAKDEIREAFKTGDFSLLPEKLVNALKPAIKAAGFMSIKVADNFSIKGEEIGKSMSESVSPFFKSHGLTEYATDDYNKFKTAISVDKTTGYAIKPDGELVSVFNSGVKGQGEASVVEAIENGATKLDAFGPLKSYYERFGFKEKSRLKWDDQYAPEGWDYAKNGRPDIVFMELEKNGNKEWEAIRRKWSDAGQNAPVYERNFRPVGKGNRRIGGQSANGREEILAGTSGTSLKIGAISEDATVEAALLAQIRRNADNARKLGIDDPFQMYFPSLSKDNLVKTFNKLRPLGLFNEGWRKQYRGLLKDEELIRNPAQAFYKIESEGYLNQYNRKIMDEVVTDFGLPKSAFKNEMAAKAEGYRMLKTKGQFGEEIGWLKNADWSLVSGQINGSFGAIDALAKATGFDALTSLFKRFVTGPFAPFHIRNWVSGKIQNFEVIGKAALDPDTIAIGSRVAARMASGSFRGVYGKTVSGEVMVTGKAARRLKSFGKETATLGGKEYYLDDIGNAVEDRFGGSSQFIADAEAVLNDANLLQDGAVFAKERMKDFGKQIKSVKGIPGAVLGANTPHFRAARVVGNFIEMQQKTEMVVAALKKGYDMEGALKLAEKAGFDYRNLSQFESHIMRRIVPFYTYNRKNIELQLKTLGENPQRINQIIRAIDNAQNLFWKQDMTDQEKKNLPAYLREYINMPVGRSDEGVLQFVRTFGTPIEAFTENFRMAAEGKGSFERSFLAQVSRVNPYLKVPIEIGFGTDSFRMKDIKDVYTAKEYQDAPQPIKDFLRLDEVKKKSATGQEYTQYVADPDRLHVMRSLFTSRGFTYFNNIYNGDAPALFRILDATTGIKSTEVDTIRQEGYTTREKEEALGDLLRRHGIVGEFNKLFIPKNQ